MLSIIAAVASNGCIGQGGRMPWRLSPDLKRLKEMTYGKTLVMGIKTYKSLKEPLEGRQHIVLTRSANVYEDTDNVTFKGDADLVFVQCRDSNDEVFVFGGGEIYKKAMPYCRKLYITEVMERFDGDAFFPEIDLSVFEQTHCSEILYDKKSGLSYRYLEYEKKRI